MVINTPNATTEPNSQPMQISPQSHYLREKDNTIRPIQKQLDLDGIRELILEMRI